MAAASVLIYGVYRWKSELSTSGFFDDESGWRPSSRRSTREKRRSEEREGDSLIRNFVLSAILVGRMEKGSKNRGGFFFFRTPTVRPPVSAIKRTVVQRSLPGFLEIPRAMKKKESREEVFLRFRRHM
ncbi:hypothetical protein KM043_010518 [Ampulex compressa]|nr:hypothetical protein KM043_010518 [Ampulex compressa]